MLRAVATRALVSVSFPARPAARGSRGQRVASLGAPRALAPRLVGGARRFAPGPSPQPPAVGAPRRGAFAATPSSSRASATDARDADAFEYSGRSSVYGDPALYELAFGFRDFDAEAAFLARLCRAHGSGAMRSVLELGAGPAWHSVSCVTTQGPCVAVALDNAPAMLERASRRARDAGCEGSVAVVRGDMTAFDADAMKAAARALVPLASNRADAGDSSNASTEKHENDASSFPGFDAVTVLLGTAAHLTTLEEAEACLRAAAAAAAPRGLVVLELEHPFDLFDGQLMDAHGDAWDREIEGGNGAKVLVEWGREGDAFDVETQIVERTVGINVVDETGRPPRDATSAFAPVEETVRCRVFTAPEIALLGKLAGLEVVATFGDMDETVPLTHEDANNMVIALRRTRTNAD